MAHFFASKYSQFQGFRILRHDISISKFFGTQIAPHTGSIKVSEYSRLINQKRALINRKSHSNIQPSHTFFAINLSNKYKQSIFFIYKKPSFYKFHNYSFSNYSVFLFIVHECLHKNKNSLWSQPYLQNTLIKEYGKKSCIYDIERSVSHHVILFHYLCGEHILIFDG